MKSPKFRLLLFSLLSGVILSLGWPERGVPLLLFFGLAPMLLIEEQIYREPGRFRRFSLMLYTYPGFFLWNLLTTWWIVNSTFIGALLAIVLNALFMTIVFQAFHWTRKKLRNDLAGYAALLSYWIAFEYLHLNWDLNWPWLNLGNGFATWYKCVQWYEYTGALGGSIWILVGNILVVLLTGKIKDQRSKIKNTDQNSTPRNLSLLRSSVFDIHYSLFLFSWIAVPILLSFLIYYTYHEEKRPVNFVVVQPNLDPYSEQYVVPPAQVIGRIMELAGPQLDPNVNFLVAPESAIQEDMWENDLAPFASIKLLKDAIAPWPKLNLLIGASTFYQLMPGEKRERWARRFTDTQNYYNAYNAAILFNSRDPLQLYHKSKLTPGVEILPSFGKLKFIEKYAIDLGGTVGSLGMDAERKVYTTVGTVKAGPAICYESIFGEFFAKFVRNGAEIMIIITNDGWWGNTAGHRQHYSFAHLRAIETRRGIARSANTGISAFIDQRGDARQATGYWVPAAIKGTLNANDKLTFYVKHGDYLARFLSYLAGVLFMASFVFSVKQRFFKKSQKSANPDK
ncbi:MAG TPA: apolipoprotein N-acyltransferase [Bacteroidales bacterium]|nr:apolipoprotein N-acyltransferase [Bacteroidales bacterium]